VVLGAAACALLTACNPSLNWREVRSKEGSLLALLPCKAEPSSRKVSLGGQEVEMALNSCTAADALFVVGQATVPEAGALVALNHWQRAALANISAPLSNQADKANQASQAVKESPLPVAGVAGTPVLLSTQGKRADGSALQFSGLWFTRGGQVFHAAIYAGKINAEMSEPFFNGLKLR
jgi:hypothetical protein